MYSGSKSKPVLKWLYSLVLPKVSLKLWNIQNEEICLVKYIHDCIIFPSSVHDDHEVNLVAFVKTVKMKYALHSYLIFDSSP